MLVVPLKFMCSTQCDTPVSPGCSSFDPTRYQHQTDASGAACSSRTSTLSPLSSVVSRIEFIIKSLDTHARVERDRQPAPHRFPDEGGSPAARTRDARAVEGTGPLRQDPGTARRC